jgi:hypothetical protein
MISFYEYFAAVSLFEKTNSIPQDAIHSIIKILNSFFFFPIYLLNRISFLCHHDHTICFSFSFVTYTRTLAENNKNESNHALYCVHTLNVFFGLYLKQNPWYFLVHRSNCYVSTQCCNNYNSN